MSRPGGPTLTDLPDPARSLNDGDSPFALEAVMTHLYASDESGGETTAAQLSTWMKH